MNIITILGTETLKKNRNFKTSIFQFILKKYVQNLNCWSK